METWKLETYHQEGLNVLYSVGGTDLSHYATSISKYLNIDNRDKANALIHELSIMSKLEFSKEIFQIDIATIAFLIGIAGDLDDFKYKIEVKEAAEMWDLTEQHVRRLCDEKKIRAKKISGKWAIDSRQPNPRTYKTK